MKNPKTPLAAPLLLSLVVLSACGSDGDASAAPSSSAESTASSTRSSEESTTSPSGGAAESSDSTGGGSGSATASASPGTTASATPPPAPRWPPPEAPAVHGGQAWGVYLAVTPGPAPELEQAVARVRSLGYSAGIASVGCDLGAAEALGVGQDQQTVAVYFASRGDAEYFLGRYDGPSVGIAQVTRYCLD